MVDRSCTWKGSVMGEHQKPADLGKGDPPPNNADGKVDNPPPSTGKHKKGK